MLAIIGSSGNATNAALVRCVAGARPAGRASRRRPGARLAPGRRSRPRQARRASGPRRRRARPVPAALPPPAPGRARPQPRPRPSCVRTTSCCTARLFAVHHLPHPRTAPPGGAGGVPRKLGLPLVLKPRFGSWGADVFRCETRRDPRRLPRRDPRPLLVPPPRCPRPGARGPARPRPSSHRRGRPGRRCRRTGSPARASGARTSAWAGHVATPTRPSPRGGWLWPAPPLRAAPT